MKFERGEGVHNLWILWILYFLTGVKSAEPSTLLFGSSYVAMPLHNAILLANIHYVLTLTPLRSVYNRGEMFIAINSWNKSLAA